MTNKNKNKKELYASGEPGLSYDPLEVDEGWEPPYRNKNACLEQVKQAVAPMRHNIDALQKELNEFRYLYGSVISRINKLEDDTRAAIEFADLAEDDRGTEMILKFCDDITELVGE